MRGPCSICENDNYHALCGKCGNCQDHCTCGQASADMPAAPLDSLEVQEPDKCANFDRAEAGIVLLRLGAKAHPRWGSIRCDLFCHRSTLPAAQCNCLCGGAFHGVAEDSARWRLHIATHGPRLVEKYKDLGVDTSGLEKEMVGQESGFRSQEPE